MSASFHAIFPGPGPEQKIENTANLTVNICKHVGRVPVGHYA